MFSEIAATFSRKRLFGYTSLVWATVCITVLSFIVWLTTSLRWVPART
ncbi:hypothetical protein ACNKHR_05305 [Shigella flexneri]